MPAQDSAADLIVTIPAFREEQLGKTIESLKACTVPAKTEVIVLFNHPRNADYHIRERHQKQLDDFRTTFSPQSNPPLSFHFLLQAIPDKHAGVGLARKIVMDEALRRIDPDGIIVALDADCTVAPNYLSEIYTQFKHHPDWHGASIYFEHMLDPGEANFDAIASYELHLRYYVEAQRFLGLPYAFHTVGSSMAIRPEIYARTGGMNRRKAGEDFYFLQKIIPHGFGDITETTVFPSGRESDRVPFGTGRAVGDLLRGKRISQSYAPESIRLVQKWLSHIYFDKPKDKDTRILEEFLQEQLDYDQHMDRIARHARSKKVFQRHFFQWFNGFALMKTLHFLRDNHFPDVPTADASKWLLKEFHSFDADESDLVGLLNQYRILQRSSSTP